MKFIPGKSIIPASGQVITDADKEILHRVVDRGWYTDFVYCEKFRRELSKVTGKKYVILTNSGSSASLIAITSVLKLNPDIQCILTSATGFPTTVAPIYQNGRIPTYVDINPKTLEPVYEQIEETTNYWKCKGNQSLSIFAHNLGFPFRERKFEEKGFLIADCCDALGAEVKDAGLWRHVGAFADVMTLSFFPAHHITSAEGGAVLTNDWEIAKMATKLVNWGRDCYCAPGESNTCGERFDHLPMGGLPVGWDHKYTFSEIGYNLKMTEFQAALGWSQLQRLDEFVEKRKENYQYLRDGLNKYANKGHIQFIEYDEWSEPSPFGFPIVVGEYSLINIVELISYLEEHKISTRRVFGGNLTRQPGFMNVPYETAGHLTGSDFVMNNAFWLGVQPALIKEMLDYVLDVFDGFFKGKGL